MSAKLSLISIMFRLLNFAMLCGAIWYIYRRYMQSAIEEQIIAQETLDKGLEEMSYMLEGQALELDDQLHAQHARAEYLKSRIQEWQDAITQADKNKQQVHLKLLERINVLMHEKSESCSRSKAYMQILPQVMARAEHELREKFAQADEQEKFLQALLGKMR